MRKIAATIAVTFVSAMQLYACSSSERFTSLAPDKTFSSLTTEERQQYCEDELHYTTTRVSKDDRKKLACAASSTAATIGRGAEAASSCQKMYKDCMGQAAPEPQSSCETFAANADGCSAKVGEATDCAEAQVDADEKGASKADAACKDLSKASPTGQETPQKTSAPEACKRVQKLCPKLFGEPVSSSTKG